MANELPDFKFNPSEYIKGDISFCSLSAQGLFTNIESYYWLRKGQLSKHQIINRRNCETEFEELVNDGIIDLDGDKIIIKFLDIQLKEIENKRKKASENGSKGGRTRKTNVAKEVSKPKILVSDRYTESEFIERWRKAREYYLKQPYIKSKLEVFDKKKLDEISKSYSKEQIDNAIRALFEQKGILKHLLLQPTHFLELKNFEMYLTCSVSGEQVYEKKGFKKPVERI